MEPTKSNQTLRRDVLKLLGMGAAAGSVLSAIPAQAAEFTHYMIAEEKAAAKSGAYAPKFFAPRQYQTLCMLCETIIPADVDSGGAIEGGAPEFIDLLTSENPHFQLTLGGGLMWLDDRCGNVYGAEYLDCTPEQRTEILDRIAYHKNAEQDPSLLTGVDFFNLLRSLTADGFFTSKIGIQYLGYVGNTFLAEFPGCPPVPGV